MGWPFSSRAMRDLSSSASTEIGTRTRRRRDGLSVDRKSALSHSAWWACRRVRADLISSMPVDVYRDMGGIQIEVTKPPVLVNPDGKSLTLGEWLYATQNDLDDVGNTVGIIRARDGLGLPSIIEPVDIAKVTVRVRAGVVTYLIAGREYAESEVWHEKQFPVSGSPVGLSPLAAAAASLTPYLSAQEFAARWFSGRTVPNAILRNQKRALTVDEAKTMKTRFKESVSDGDVFVTGNDWDYQMINATTAAASFIEERQLGVVDVCRFGGVPSDMIDGMVSGSAITYANVGQRNLQLMIVNLGPAVKRREDKLSQLTPKPRFVKLRAEAALLRMDPKSRYDSYKVGIDSRFLAPSEARALEDRMPFTPEQEAEFGRLFPNKSATPAVNPSGVSS